MVWPFSSPDSASSPPTYSQEQNPSPQSTSTPTPSPPTPTKALTRDEIADQELRSFLSELESSDTPLPVAPKRYTRLASSPTTPATTSSRSSHNNNESLSEHLFPTTMSCRQAFDSAFYCNSFGGRFNDLYRYGTLRSCSDTWNDFWFCMKTKGYAEAQKEEVIRAHYKGKERKKYGVDRRGMEEEVTVGEEGKEKSKGRGDGLGEGLGVMGYRGRGSEDVWRSRERLVEEGTAFKEAILGWEKGGNREGDGVWNEREREKRKVDAERLS